MRNIKLMTRDEFRRTVFSRDKYSCVVCGRRGDGDIDHRDYTLDSHHIIDRSLFTADYQLGGYFLDNGATLCSIHHIEAERTILSCDQIRKAAGIERLLLPEHLDQEVIDKWGNPIQPNGTRLRGELFFEDAVQSALSAGGMLNMFCEYVKYPRTYHAPWSNPSSEDKVLKSIERFEGQEVVVLEKMDGENFSGYRDHAHARSLDFLTGQDRGMVKSVWGQIAHDIPEGWRVCGENLYATHSIHYENLTSFLYIFSIWNERNECLSWDDTEEWSALLGLTTVPVLYRGVYDEQKIRGLYDPNRQPDPMEGYVVRLASSFPFVDFRRSVMKYVRKSHLNTDKHWPHSRKVPNKLKQVV